MHAGGTESRIKEKMLKKGCFKQIESLLDNNILVRPFGFSMKLKSIM